MIITQTAIDYGDNNGISQSQTDGSNFERSSSLAPWGVVIDYSTDESIYGSTIYYNPFIHTNIGTVEFGIPTRGFKYKVPLSGALSSNMAPVGLGSYAPQRETNEVVIEIIDANTFKIYHNYYQWWDHGNYYPNVSKNAYDILFKSHQSAASQFVNSFSSVYNTLKTYYAHVYVDALTPSTDGEINTYFGVQNLYYNKLKLGWTSLQSLSRLSGPVSDLSAFEKTKVTFQITRPPSTSDTAPEAFIYLFRGDPTFPTNAQPVWTDVAAEIMPIYDDPSTGTISGGKIYGPLVQPFLTGDTWEASFYIGGVATGERYHAAILWYIHPDDGPAQFWYSVTLINTTETPYIVQGEPEVLTLDIAGQFDDYAKTESVNKPYYCPAQRFKWRGIIDGTGYDAAAVIAGSPFNSLAIDCNQLKLTVTSCSTLVNYTAYRTLGGWITSHPSLIIQDFGSILYVELDFRALYGGAYADWQTCGVDFDLTAVFDYTPAIPGFIVEYKYLDSCQIQRWDQEGALFQILTAINFFKASDGTPLQMICGDEDVRVQVVLDTSIQGIDPTDYIFQAFLDKSPFGVNLFSDANLKEHETYPPNTIAQKTNAAMYAVDLEFNALGKAYFTVAASSLIPGASYYVYGAAVKKSLP